MATDWTTTAELTFSDRDQWKSKVSGNAEDTGDFKSVAEAPENLMLDPEDIDIAPEAVQVDNDSWVAVSVPKEPGSWTTVSSISED